ncbi:unnamed protein product [Leptosia nina]|uniref:Odorant receptor n=1 Tax=Leptosia nina TaxID=320188 RepID=A0AAV1JIB9_9NEOP
MGSKAVARREIEASLKLSASKASVLWYKKTVFKRLLRELIEIWPVTPEDIETQNVKDKSLKTLRSVHACQVCVWVTISSDLLFSGFASHIVLLLRILQDRLKNLTVTGKSETEYHQRIVECIKLHQRLIRYCKDIGEAFSFVNLVNIVLSSINICCVVFTILLLEPLVAVSNKLFLMSALTQVGILCWYGHDIIHAKLKSGGPWTAAPDALRGPATCYII